MEGERVSYDDMTTAQKQAAFEKWMKSRKDRKKVNSIKRDATRTLIANHQDEFNALIAGGGKTPAKAS